MKTSEILKDLRMKNNLTQDELAEKLNISRQAISKWENEQGDPNIESLKLLSKTFDVSINTLLGSPRELICQCCGMPISDDEQLSRELDNSFNEEYCKWCYTNGDFAYDSKDKLLDFLLENMKVPNMDNSELKTYLDEKLSRLKYWN